MIYISNNDDEINVVCDFERLGIDPNELTQERLESLMEFVRINGQLWDESACQDTVNKRKEAIHNLNTILVGDEEEKYRKDDVVKELECGHYFHESCILRWAETSGSCPFCRCCFARDEEAEGPSNNGNEMSQLLIDRVDLLREFVLGNPSGARLQTDNENSYEESGNGNIEQIYSDSDE